MKMAPSSGSLVNYLAHPRDWRGTTSLDDTKTKIFSLYTEHFVALSNEPTVAALKLGIIFSCEWLRNLCAHFLGCLRKLFCAQLSGAHERTSRTKWRRSLILVRNILYM